MSDIVFQQMSAKHVYYVLQLSNISYNAMTKMITTISLKKRNHTWVL